MEIDPNALYVFIDGSCFNNQAKNKSNTKGGYGVFFGNNDPRNISKCLEYKKITNNTAELMACLEALTVLEKCIKEDEEKYKNDSSYCKPKIYLVTDSKYLYNSCIDWIPKWEKNNWIKSNGKPVDNKELLVNIREKYKFVKPLLKHVNSHLDEPSDKKSLEWKLWYGNMMADKFATDGTKQNFN